MSQNLMQPDSQQTLTPYRACSNIVLSRFACHLFSIFLLSVTANAAFNATETQKNSTRKSAEKASAATAETPPFKAIIALNIARKMPVAHTADKWNPYTLGGLSLQLPSYTPQLSVRFSLNAGIVDSKPEYNAEILAFHESAAIVYAFSIMPGRLDICPVIGLSHTTIFPRDNFTIKAQEFFRDSESEFGLTGGIEPTILLNKIRILIPAFAECIFAAPNPFISVTISLNAGVAF